MLRCNTLTWWLSKFQNFKGLWWVRCVNNSFLCEGSLHFILDIWLTCWPDWHIWLSQGDQFESAAASDRHNLQVWPRFWTSREVTGLAGAGNHIRPQFDGEAWPKQCWTESLAACHAANSDARPSLLPSFRLRFPPLPLPPPTPRCANPRYITVRGNNVPASPPPPTPTGSL